METTRLKYTEVAGFRSYLLEQQQYRCGLCDEEITDAGVLDHDHRTGLVRLVLHRGCNLFLGKIECNLKRNHIDFARLMRISERVAEYLNTQHTYYTHPTYKTKEQKMAYKRRKGTKPKPKYLGADQCL